MVDKAFADFWAAIIASELYAIRDSKRRKISSMASAGTRPPMASCGR